MIHFHYHYRTDHDHNHITPPPHASRRQWHLNDCSDMPKSLCACLYTQTKNMICAAPSKPAYFNITSCTSVDPDVPGLGIVPNSSPTPLCPLFLPPMWNLDVVVVPGGFGVCDSELSPNLEKNPFFLGCFASSFNPTSSKPSSVVGGCLSKYLSLTADRGILGIRTESRLCRPFSDCMIGERAEIS